MPRIVPEDEKEPLLRGKYPAWRFPMLAEHPDIEPGQNWDLHKPLPEGFRLDKSSRIWPIPVKKGRIAPPEKRCIADGKNTPGQQCPNYRMKGKNVCFMHGGAERAGIDHPNTTTGERLSKGIFGDAGLPPALSDWYARAIEDPGIYDLTHNIAMLTGREREILGGLSTGEAKANWKSVSDLTEDLIQATKDDDAERIVEIVKKLRAVAKAGRTDTQVWAEFTAIGERKRRLVESERKRRLELKSFVTADQLRGILRANVVIVFQEINSIPTICATMVRNEGKLDTGKLSQVLTANIGRRMGQVAEGMKAGRLSDEHINSPGALSH